MAVFKCKMCGGSLEIPNGISVATCEYCGTKQTVPKSRDEVVSNLFNRANNLRLKCEFDKAEQVYEKILDIDNTDSEAHWGIVLCKYGIEYVEDPKTYSRIPTCHRTLYEAVLTDVNYLAAIENADAEQKELYIAESKIIDELQKNILNIVNSEEPIDVFLCYKETDENGKRTIDSAIANDIYYQLTQEGFKVFYAPITLEDKLGHEYEPYIFAALNSAKVMLVVGTKPEYFDSVWVRNEWSRFFKSMKNDHSKLLIPCYRNMDAYELPNEFAHLQAQDMSKIGFISDVIRGLKKVFNRDEQANYIAKKYENPRKKKSNKVKTFFVKIINKLKRKKLDFYLSFPAPKFAKVFFVFTLIFYLYCVFKAALGWVLEDVFILSLLFGMPLIILALVFFKIIKRKPTALVLLGLSSVVGMFSVPPSDLIDLIESGFFFQFILMIVLWLVWFVYLCFSKKKGINEKTTIKPKFSVSITAIFIALTVLFELYGTSFIDYQFAKMFYHFGAYDYATEYFTALGDYKDSSTLATKTHLLKIKNANIMDIVELGYWYDKDGVSTDSLSSWYVVAKEDTSVLLLKYSNVECATNPTIIGGWEDSTLRKFLNEEYYNSVFNEEIKKRIEYTVLINSDDYSDLTTDKIFILSKDEIKMYFPKAQERQGFSYYGSLLRNVEGNVYTVLTDDGDFNEIPYDKDFILQKDANGDGKITLSEYAQFKESGSEFLSECTYHPAMWIDLSDIE